MTTRRVGLKDVARAAGVSVGTVSHVLNHPERVSESRREAVQRAIERLGFVRDESARQLRAGYSSTVGLLLLDAWNPAFAEMARGVEDAAAEAGMTLLMANSARSLEREKASLTVFSEHRVAGAIVVPHDPLSSELHRVRAGGVPLVVLDRMDPREGAVSVGVDDTLGGRLAAEHLLRLGHRAVAFAGDPALAIPVRDRHDGVSAVVAEAGATLVDLPCALSVEGGREVGAAIAAMPAEQRPGAVACAVDVVAVGILQELQRHGIRVPEDVSVVGYDDIPLAAQLAVPLTTVARPHHAMGVAAFTLLLAVVRGETPHEPHRLFAPALVVRGSSGPAAPTTTDGST